MCAVASIRTQIHFTAKIGQKKALVLSNHKNLLSKKVLLWNPFYIKIGSIVRGVAQFGSALDWGSRGRWFKSSRPDFP